MLFGKHKTHDDLYMIETYWWAWRPVHLEDGRWAWLTDVMRCKSSGLGVWYKHIAGVTS